MSKPRTPSGKRKSQARAVASRKTFMLDPQNEQDLQTIRSSLRATTDSEALRFSVRKVAELMAWVAQGGRVLLEPNKKDKREKEMTVLDIPPAIAVAR